MAANPVADLCTEILYNVRFFTMMRLVMKFNDYARGAIFRLPLQSEYNGALNRNNDGQHWPSRNAIMVKDHLIYVGLSAMDFEQGFDPLEVCG